MDPKTILSRIRKAKPKITILGESLLDVWHIGNLGVPAQEDNRVRRFVTERKIEMAGGAANVRVSLAVLLGAPVHHLTSPVISRKSRWWDEGEQRLVFRHDQDGLAAEQEWGIITIDRNLLISDYGKGMFTWPQLRQMSGCFPKAIFSPHLMTCRKFQRDQDLTSFKDWIWVVNCGELSTLADTEDTARAKMPSRVTLIETMGSENVAVYRPGYFAEFIPVQNVTNHLHTVGIGDCFLAAFSAATFSGIELRDAVEFAIQVCGSVLIARRPGTCCIQEEDLR